MKNLIVILIFSSFTFNTFFSQTNEIDSLKMIITNMPDDTNKVKNIIELSQALYRYREDSAIFYSFYSEKISRKLNYYYGIIESIKCRAISLKFNKEFDSSILITKNFIIEQPLEMEKQYYSLYSNLFSNYSILMKFDSSKIYLDKYLAFDSTSNTALFMQEEFYSLTGNLKKSSDCLHKIINKENQNLDKADALYMLSINLFSIKDYKLAKKHAEEALSIYLNYPTKKNHAKSYRFLGMICGSMNKIKMAEENYLKSIDLFEEMNNLSSLASTYSDLAEDIYNTDSLKSLVYYEKAIEISEKSKSSITSKFFIQSAGWTLYNKGKNKNFIKDTLINEKTFINFAEQTQNLELLSFLYEFLAENNFQKKDYLKSSNFYKKLFSIKDSILKKGNNEVILNLQTEYETEKKEAQIVLQDKELALQKASIAKERQQKWIVGGGALLLMLLAGLFYSRYRSKQKFKLEKQQLTAEKDIVELEQKLLLTQMNPHFIFNSLNSIKAFIISNKSTEANSYLSDFSKLMRLILDSSRKELIPLEDEVNMLSYYLKLEQLRLGNKMEYDIYINPELQDELEEISIPPMLIQPYIENAIKHGITNKTEIGKITLSFDYGENDTIKIDIIDDGVGREKAMEIKSRVIQTHESAAMQITQERIEGFNRDNTNNPIEIKIIDLLSDNQVATGTRVSVVLPALSA